MCCNACTSSKHRLSNLVLANNALVDLHADEQTPAAAGSGRPFHHQERTQEVRSGTMIPENVIHSYEMTRSVSWLHVRLTYSDKVVTEKEIGKTSAATPTSAKSNLN